jgi:MFS family permease
VAGVYICAWGVGDALGPLLGGFLTGVLPSTPEVVCTSPDPDGGCLTAFPWASALYGGAVLLLWALLTCLVPGDKGKRADRVAKREDSGDPSLVHLLHDEDRHVMTLNGPASPIVMEAATENGAHYQTIGRHPSARQKESFG